MSSASPARREAIVSDVVESLRAKAEAKHLRLEVEFMGAIPPAIATDRLRLQQILVNLLDNAIKFTEQREVRLTVRRIDRPDGDRFLQFAWRHRHRDDGGRDGLACSSRSTGSGSADSRQPGGTGLGLAICERLARRLGGDIDVQSTPGEGSTFTLSIPVGPHRGAVRGQSTADDRSPKAAPTASSQPARPGSNARHPGDRR